VQRIGWYLGIGILILAAGCREDRGAPVEPAPPAVAKDGGGSGLRAMFTRGDYVPGSGESLVLTEPGCSGAVTRSYNVDFTVDDCLEMITTNGVVLTDDAFFAFATTSGSIVGAQFWIDDQSGREGIGHESDKTRIDPPQPASSSGFTLHVHATVPVWRLGGHLAKKRVAQVGTVTIGDVVFYRP
jgi:hypothetical protein